MEKIYANLLGEWQCLNEDKNCVMGPNEVSPTTWWEESAKQYSPIQRTEADTLYQSRYVTIKFKNITYDISPQCIQIIHE